MTRQLVRFAAIGVVSTLAYLALFLLLRDPLGAQAANLLALLLTAVANTAANRRLTFGVRGSARRMADQAQGLVVFGLGLALTSGALMLLAATTTDPSRAVEVCVLVAANLTATLVRFVGPALGLPRPRLTSISAARTSGGPTAGGVVMRAGHHTRSSRR